MNKQELVAAVAAETSMPKKCVEAVLKSILPFPLSKQAKLSRKLLTLNRLKKVKNNTWLPARCRNAAGFFVGITALFMSRNRPRLCLMLCVLWYFETTGGLTKSKD